jgi:hypothetical protein
MFNLRSVPSLLLTGWRHTGGTAIGQLSFRTLVGGAAACGILWTLGLG